MPINSHSLLEEEEMLLEHVCFCCTVLKKTETWTNLALHQLSKPDFWPNRHDLDLSALVHSRHSEVLPQFSRIGKVP